jgi:hypothetical protein
MQPIFRPSVPFEPPKQYKSGALRDPQAKTSYSEFQQLHDLRTEHLRRLIDVSHVCLQRGDLDRAARAFAILVRCKNAPLAMEGWHALSMAFARPGAAGTNEAVRGKSPKTLADSILRLIALGRSRQALDELEL